MVSKTYTFYKQYLGRENTIVLPDEAFKPAITLLRERWLHNNIFSTRDGLEIYLSKDGVILHRNSEYDVIEGLNKWWNFQLHSTTNRGLVKLAATFDFPLEQE